MKTKLKQNNKGVVTVFVVLMNFVGLKTLRESSPNQFCIFKIEGILVTLNFSFMEIPTSFYEKSDQLIGFCVLELV